MIEYPICINRHIVFPTCLGGMFVLKCGIIPKIELSPYANWRKGDPLFHFSFSTKDSINYETLVIYVRDSPHCLGLSNSGVDEQRTH